MNDLRLGQCLGTVPAPSFRRTYNESQINSLSHQNNITFTLQKSTFREARDEIRSRTLQSPPASGSGFGAGAGSSRIAHQAGVNCLAIDPVSGRYLFSGGADSTIRVWDLEKRENPTFKSQAAGNGGTNTNESQYLQYYRPTASLTRGSAAAAHTHALTSISIYPFDPTPTTLLSTSYDKTLKVTSITPTSLVPVHTFDLDFLPYTHCMSTVVDASPLIAVGTAHPAVRLLDLRTGLSTHSLSGPNGAVYTVSWSPKKSFLLASGSADGRVLFYDIRRANAVFASLDLDDAVGVVGEFPSTGAGARPELLDFHAVAHNGPVTSVQWTPSGDRLVTTGHDQRIRVWDTSTGRNELVHFGPRIRNERHGELKPLISPLGTHRPGHESLFWPNDDGRGVIFQHHLREGHLLQSLRTQGIKLAEIQAAAAQSRGGGRARGRGGAGGGGGGGGAGGGGGSSSLGRLTSGGRINAMVWRSNAPAGDAVEMYTAHGDGSICAWMPRHAGAGAGAGTADQDEEADPEADVGQIEPPSLASTPLPQPAPADAEEDADRRRKRKRELMADLVEGLARRPMRFS
ncbi:DNA excision repair protein ERCC-8 [Exophiala dermatitidis]